MTNYQKWDNFVNEMSSDEEELAAEEAKQHCHNEACERASATTHK